MLEISLPTSAKQDTILTKQDTTLSRIGSSNPTVADETSVMNYLKKINNTQLPVGGLKPVTIFNVLSSSSTTTVLNITGSGFLVKAVEVISLIFSGTITFGIKVTIDGVLILDTTSISVSSQSSCYGIGITDKLYNNGTETNVNNFIINAGPIGGRVSSIRSYSTGNVFTGGDVIVNLEGTKIPFNKSLKVEVSGNGTTVNRAYEVVAEVY